MYDSIKNFFGTRFHQDWMLDFESEEENIRNFVQENKKEFCLSIVSDIDKLLNSGFSDKRLRKVITRDLGADLVFVPKEFPRWYNWLKKIRFDILNFLDEKK